MEWDVGMEIGKLSILEHKGGWYLSHMKGLRTESRVVHWTKPVRSSVIVCNKYVSELYTNPLT